MSSVDNQQLNNIIQDAVNATANAHQKYIDALEQKLKDKDAEIERLKAENAKVHKVIPQMIKTAKSEAAKEFAKMLMANKIKGEFAQRDDYYVNVINIDQLEEIAGDAL